MANDAKLIVIFVTAIENYRKAITRIFSNDSRFEFIFRESLSEIDPSEITENHRVLAIRDVLPNKDCNIKHFLEDCLNLA